MEMKIGESFWVVDGKERKIFDSELEAVGKLKDDIKAGEESTLKMFTFKEEGEVEYKQVGWETIAKQLIKEGGGK